MRSLDKALAAAGAFLQLEKVRLVAKLKAAQDRKRKANGKCEGRKSYAARACRKSSRWPSSSKLRGYRIARSVQSLPSLATSRALASRTSHRRCRKCLSIRKWGSPAITSVRQEPPGLPVQTGVRGGIGTTGLNRCGPYRRPVTGGLSASDKVRGFCSFCKRCRKCSAVLEARHHARGNIFYGSAAIE